LEGIDAIIAGHTHLHLPGTAHSGLGNVCAETGTVWGKPVAMPGACGSHLGVIDLRLDISPQARWSVTGFDCTLRPISERQADGSMVSTVPKDRTLTKLIEADHSATQAQLQQVVGYTDRPLLSYFSFIAPDYSMTVAAAAQAASVRAALTGTAAADLPLLSAVAPCKFGGRSGPLHYTDVSAGTISLRHVADLYVFPNQLCAVILDTSQVLDWLEKAASLFHQITPGSTDATLIDPAIPGHNFDVLHGLTWQIDLSVPPQYTPHGEALYHPGQRICDLRLNDAPVAPNQRFVVALNSYRANGGGLCTTSNNAEPLSIPAINVREAICNYLAVTSASDPSTYAASAWRLKPMPGTSVSILTGPGAMVHMDELKGRNAQTTGPGPDGFLCLTLPL
jgi:2',3'-cyclic-nucleotide 2'-phosphodiesterase/3'-nucleotidase